ncbi:MAG: CAP domain-containing protein [Polyangiaceae bacterium]
MVRRSPGSIKLTGDHDGGLRRRQLLAGALAMGCARCAGTPERPKAPSLEDLERSMLERVNRDRQAAGVPALAHDDALTSVARAHADDMRRARFFSHTSPTTGKLEDRLARARIAVLFARENLADAPDVDAAEDGLLASPGHRENLLSTDVTHIGIGVAEGGFKDAGNRLFVQVFAKPAIRQSTDVARQTVIERIGEERKRLGLPPATIDANLDEVARAKVTELEDSLSDAALAEVGRRVAEDQKKRGKAGSITVTGQRVVSATEYTPSASLLTPAATAIGVGVAEARDERGGPAVKILVLAAVA